MQHDASPGGRAGPPNDAYRSGVRGNLGGAVRSNGGSAMREGRTYDQRPMQADAYGQRAPRVAPAPLPVQGYGPNSRHGYREGRAAVAQPRSDWGAAQRSEWQQGSTGVRHMQQGHTHGDGYQPVGMSQVAMHPPPDQIGVPRTQPALQLQPGTVVLQAQHVHAVPQHVQAPAYTQVVHTRVNALPPDVQPIQRYNPSCDRPRMGSVRQEDDLGWRGQRGGNTSSRGHSRGASDGSDYRQPYAGPEHSARSRSHRR
jgi:hypothetical protein